MDGLAAERIGWRRARYLLIARGIPRMSAKIAVTVTVFIGFPFVTAQ